MFWGVERQGERETEREKELDLNLIERIKLIIHFNGRKYGSRDLQLFFYK